MFRKIQEWGKEQDESNDSCHQTRNTKQEEKNSEKEKTYRVDEIEERHETPFNLFGIQQVAFPKLRLAAPVVVEQVFFAVAPPDCLDTLLPFA